MTGLQSAKHRGCAGWAWVCVALRGSRGLRAVLPGSATIPSRLPPRAGWRGEHLPSAPLSSCPPPAHSLQPSSPRKPELARPLSSGQSQHWEEMFIFFSKLPQLLRGG